MMKYSPNLIGSGRDYGTWIALERRLLPCRTTWRRAAPAILARRDSAIGGETETCLALSSPIHVLENHKRFTRKNTEVLLGLKQ